MNANIMKTQFCHKGHTRSHMALLHFFRYHLVKIYSYQNYVYINTNIM